MGRISLKSLAVVVAGLVVGILFMVPAFAQETVGERSVLEHGEGHCSVLNEDGEWVETDWNGGVVGDGSTVCVLANVIRRDLKGGSDALAKAETGSNTTTAGAAFAFIGIGLLLHASSLKRQGA